MTLKEVFEKGKHDPRLRIDRAKFEDINVSPISHKGETVGFYRETQSLTGAPMMGAIYVLPQYRRQGIANRVVKDFYSKHPDMVYITTDTNKASQALAKSVGLQYTKRPKGNPAGMVFEKNASSAISIMTLPIVIQKQAGIFDPIWKASKFMMTNPYARKITIGAGTGAVVGGTGALMSGTVGGQKKNFAKGALIGAGVGAAIGGTFAGVKGIKNFKAHKAVVNTAPTPKMPKPPGVIKSLPKMAGLKKHAYSAKEVTEMVTPGRKYPFSYLTGEAKELYQAIKSKDKAAIADEKGDVMYAAQMLLHQRTGINFRLRGVDTHVEKFLERQRMWENIMGRYGVTYHPNLLEGGGNYKRPEKIRAALRAGGYNITDQELVGLEPIVGGFEKKAKIEYLKAAGKIGVPLAVMGGSLLYWNNKTKKGSRSMLGEEYKYRQQTPGFRG